MAAYGLFLIGFLVLLSAVVLLARQSATQLHVEDDVIELESVGRLSTRLLYANVVVTQGLVLLLLLGLLWWTEIPHTAIGVTIESGSWGFQVVSGVLAGLILYVANQGSVAVLDRYEIEYSHALRRGLAPDSVGGWVLLFGVVLPVIAMSEELLFRAAAIGVISAGFPISPWVLVALSAVVFAIGHGAQGTGGIIVTGALGLVLGGLFVYTGSLILVIVAHYVVNGLEIGVHEGVLPYFPQT